MNFVNIKKAMLGHLADNVELVILTPLKSTFKKLKERLDIKMIYENVFFENCTFSIAKDGKKGLLILSPQGIASKDIVELFENTKILFFGLAGSLHSKLKIGTFVEIKTAIYKKEKIKLTTTGNLDAVQCGYSPCLIGKIAEEYYNIAKANKCDVIDMETTACAKTAIENNNEFTAVLLISDIPNIVNFWEIPEDIKTEFAENREKSIDKIINYINVLMEE